MRAKILIVDDDPDILRGLKDRIASMGHEPITAENGKEALRLIEEGDFDLALLDLELPFLSGLEILERVRNASHSERRTEEDTSATYTTPLSSFSPRSAPSSAPFRPCILAHLISCQNLSVPTT